MPNAITNTATMCNGCPKDPIWTATGWKCPVFSNPEKTYGARNGTYCSFNPPLLKNTAKKKVNPLKKSKRGM